jgi:hypothetical protein
MLEVMPYDFIERFKAMSDIELIEAFNKEVGNPGWVSARAAYLMALHDEFVRRGFDYSSIGSAAGLSLATRIKLIDKKIVPFV